MVAIVGAPLDQAPPVAVSVKVAVSPIHNAGGIDIMPAPGKGATVTIRVSTAVPQLLVTAYEMILLPPATPVTMPPVLMVATDILLLLHAPPTTELETEAEPDSQT
jgi:hypothetical protein